MHVESAAAGMTTWHITWGTHGARLHGGDRPTVERARNEHSDRFVDRDEKREQAARNRMRGNAVILTAAHRSTLESLVPELCGVGNWTLRVCAAGPEGDHVHVLLDAPAAVHGKTIRTLLKRWLTQALDDKYGKPPGGKWWADGGSTRPVKDPAYLQNVTAYIRRQRTTQ